MIDSRIAKATNLLMDAINEHHGPLRRSLTGEEPNRWTKVTEPHPGPERCGHRAATSMSWKNAVT